MNRTFARALALCSATMLFACVEPPAPEPPSATQAAAEADAPTLTYQRVASFEGVFDPDAETPLRVTSTPLYRRERVSGGAIGTVELGTTEGSICFSPTACGFPNAFPYSVLGAFGAEVTLTSHLTEARPATYMEIINIEPSEGHDGYAYPLGTGADPTSIVAGPGQPIDARGGLWSLGAVAPGETVRKQILFQYQPGPFRFSGWIVVAVPERVNGSDDNGDGRIDEGPLADGEACADASACFSGVCEGGVCVPGGDDGSVGNCDGETPWETIAPSLLDYVDLLPELPGDRLSTTWPAAVPTLFIDRIEPDERLPTDPYATATCETPPWWDVDRVDVGGAVVAADPAQDHCRVQASGQAHKEELYFQNRYRTGSIHVPVTGEPGWVRMRFPVPPGHEALSFSYEVGWARLFGSHPSACHSADQDESGACVRNALAPDEVWDDVVPPGLFLLWGRSDECSGWVITGPHEPAGTASWGTPERFTVDVPASLRGVEELSVAMLVYRQYPGGCDGSYCVSAAGTYANIALAAAELRTEEVFAPPMLPPTDHPRLFGPDEAWLARAEAFDNIPCRGAPDWPEGAQWGTVTNIRNRWDFYTRGGADCLGEAPTSLYDHPDAAAYLDGSAVDRMDVARALRVLHVLRREMACADGLTDCRFPAAEVDQLADAIIAIEMARIRDWPWETFGFPMDLRTREPMRVFVTLADVLWDELSEAEHALILEVTGEHIDGFESHYEDRHWAIYNGNNWTPVIAEAALTWAIVYYHDDPRAQRVARRAMDILWLHRDQYLPDGVYSEGMFMYSQVSFDPVAQVNRLAESAFGLTLASVPWERMPGFTNWLMSFMAPDGSTIDFSDAWAKRGWGTFMPLLAHMADPVSGGFTQEPDPCFAERFFANKYYDHGLADPWKVDLALARDWQTIVSGCDEDLAREGVEVSAWQDGGWGLARVGLPGTTTIAAEATGRASRLGQADEVMLAVSAIDNAQPHTELDFATLVWSAFGNRLIVDPGYGTLSGDRYATEPDASCDQNPTGHNTLVVPEALLDGDPSTNTSQIDGEAGTIAVEEIDGVRVLTLDGSAVYGRDDVALGWLERFVRRLLVLESGVALVIDDVEVRADRGAAAVEERWHTRRAIDADPEACSSRAAGAEVTVTPTDLTIAPRCSMLRNGPAESAGRVVGLALEPGGFESRPWFPFFDRLNNEVFMQRFAWAPDAPVTRDLRVFALVPATSAAALPDATLRWSTPCADDLCATLALDGVDTLRLGFSDGAERALVAVEAL